MPARSGKYTLKLDTREGHQKVEVWRHGIMLAPNEALEVVLEAYERLRVDRRETPEGS